jgi:hypothetical protein
MKHVAGAVNKPFPRHVHASCEVSLVSKIREICLTQRKTSGLFNRLTVWILCFAGLALFRNHSPRLADQTKPSWPVADISANISASNALWLKRWIFGRGSIVISLNTLRHLRDIYTRHIRSISILGMIKSARIRGNLSEASVNYLVPISCVCPLISASFPRVRLDRLDRLDGVRSGRCSLVQVHYSEQPSTVLYYRGDFGPSPRSN